MKKKITYLVITLFSLLCTAYGSDDSVWKKATSLYGSNADRYLYLALPYGNEEDNLLLPLNKEGKSYFVKRASYSVFVDNGTEKGNFDIDFGIKKTGLTIRGIKDGLVIDLGEKKVYDIFFKVDNQNGGVEFHNYFSDVPKGAVVQLFPGFFGSELFGRYSDGLKKQAAGFVGWSIKEGKNEFFYIDPSSYSDMGAEPFESGDRKLLHKRSLLDFAAENWSLISELRIWNIFHYGIGKSKERRLTGFLKIEFYVKPLSEPLRFGNITLPFSNVWYEVNYKLSSELAKAALLASDNSLVPKRSHFIFRKKAGNKEIDFEVEIDIDDIDFESLDNL